MFKKKVQGEDTQVEVTPKKKKKIKKRYIVLGLVAVLVVGSIISNGMSANMPTPVMVRTVEVGDLTQTLDTSGTVESEEVKNYFAQVNGEIQTLNAELGTSIKAGENLLTYNVEKMERSVKQAELEAAATDYGIDASITTMNHSQKKATEAAKDYEDAVKYVNHYSACVASVKEELTKASQAAAQVESISAELATQQAKLQEKPNSEKIQNKVKSLEKELKAAKKEAAKYDTAALQASLETCSADLAAYESLKAQYEAQKEADPSYNSQLAQQAALKQANSIQKEATTEDLETARNGVNAEFDGIITEVAVVEGQTVAQGTPLFTIANEKQVKVSIEVSKYDLSKIAVDQQAKITINNKEYEGYVAKIDRFAHENKSGASVLSADIHINNPDENIYLGIEGKVSIQTGEVKDAILIPMECINADMEGDFCYVVEDGVIVRRNVEIGISSDEYSQVISGLKEGEQVVSQVDSSIIEGMSATPIDDTLLTEDGVTTQDATTENGTSDDTTTQDAAAEETTTDVTADDADAASEEAADDDTEKDDTATDESKSEKQTDSQ